MLKDVSHYLKRGLTKGCKKEKENTMNKIFTKIAEGLEGKNQTEINNILAEKERRIRLGNRMS